MYLAEGTHPVIIDTETYHAVQREISVRQALGYLANQSIAFSCFTSKIICGRCRKAYRRKTYVRKGYTNRYHKWVCSTKITRGAHECPSCNVPERALYQMTADILHTEQVPDELFTQKINQIVVSGDHELTFMLTDGREEVRTWQDERNNTIYNRRRVYAAS